MITKKVISKEMREIVNEQIIITCDLCKNVVPNIKKCYICGRDMCSKCTTYDERDMGDYPTAYCDECWEIGKEYMKKMVDLQTECDNQIENLNIGWRNKARNAAMQKV